MHKLVLPAFALSLLILTASIVECSAAVSVGVKPGDYIEYQVNVSGNPPADHAIKWARMEVTDVQDGTIGLDIQSQLANGTIFPEHITLNLATGILGDDFFIPKDLNVGDQFYDATVGNITIMGMEQRMAAGAERTVISASTNATTFYWDREFGILVAATSHMDTYDMTTVANGTNMWQPQPEPTEGLPVYLLVGAVVIVVVAAGVLVVFMRCRKKSA